MPAAVPPIIHILAGPNGAGKTSLYEGRIRQLTDAEFVNADRLAFKVLGRHSATREEAQLGQRLAGERRGALMSAGADRAFVFDNSALGRPPRRLITFVRGKAEAIAGDLPHWCEVLYATELR